MEKIGEILRKKRLEKNLSLEEIEKNTRIRRRYLEALENEEWDIFPGLVYLKGFMKTYCRYLGVNEKSFINALEERLTPSPPAEPLPEKIELPGRPRRKIALIMGVITIMILLASQFIYKIIIDQPLTNANTPPVSSNSSQIPPSGQLSGDRSGESAEPLTVSNGGNTEVSQENPAAELETLALRIKVINYKCWVIVKNRNQLVFEGTLQKGEEKTFYGLPEIYMGLGNAGDVEVYLNEKDLGVLGAKGEVVYKKFMIENNEIKEINLSPPSHAAS